MNYQLSDFDCGAVKVIKRKGMKNLRLRVCDKSADILVSTPYFVGKQEVRDFVAEHMDWLGEEQAKVKRRLERDSRPWSQRKNIYLFGKTCDVRFSFWRKQTVQVSYDGFALHVNCPEDVSGCKSLDQTIEEAFEKSMRRILFLKSQEYKEKWELVLGVHAKELRIKKMRTRWGSCNIEAQRIWLSFALIYKPDICLDYVVLHELVHLVEKNHTRKFWSIIDKVFPPREYCERILAS